MKDKKDIFKGIHEGFELKGAYQGLTQGGWMSLSFQEKQGDESSFLWWFRSETGVHESGYIERTIDPNVYLILNHQGTQTGQVHLAYSNAQAEGVLFVEFRDSDMIELQKVSRVPSVIE